MFATLLSTLVPNETPSVVIFKAILE
jgi:hypothetical protein